jgi:hypothetical protein
LACLDKTFAERLGAPERAGAWWLAPLPPDYALHAKAIVPDARYACGADFTGTNSWFLVRSFAGGFTLLERNLRELRAAQKAAMDLLREDLRLLWNTPLTGSAASVNALVQKTQ